MKPNSNMYNEYILVINHLKITLCLEQTPQNDLILHSNISFLDNHKNCTGVIKGSNYLVFLSASCSIQKS